MANSCVRPGVKCDAKRPQGNGPNRFAGIVLGVLIAAVGGSACSTSQSADELQSCDALIALYERASNGNENTDMRSELHAALEASPAELTSALATVIGALEQEAIYERSGDAAGFLNDTAQVAAEAVAQWTEEHCDPAQMSWVTGSTG